MKTVKLEEQSQAAGTNKLHFMFYFLDRPGATSEVFLDFHVSNIDDAMHLQKKESPRLEVADAAAP